LSTQTKSSGIAGTMEVVKDAGALAGHPQAPQPMIENGTEQHRRWPRFAAATMSRFRVRGSGNDLLTVVKAGEASRC